jgi:membrane-associated phospholipid phosphatase
MSAESAELKIAITDGEFVRGAAGFVSTRRISRLKQRFAECGAFEWVALGYSALSGALMIAFRENLPNAALHLSVHAAVMLAILALANVAQIFARDSGSRAARLARWIRDWYPQAVFLFCFEELRVLVHLIQPVWQDAALIRFDRRLTGVDPASWLMRIANPALNDAMQAAYLTYFFYLTVLGASLYSEMRKADTRGDATNASAAYRTYWTVMTSSIAAYAIGYVVAIFFPIESPYYAQGWMNSPALSGGPATALINFIEHFGRVHGGAFPSAHVSGSFVALLGAWRYRRRMFWIFLPLFFAMCVATVYGRYHYIADVFAGLLAGALGFCGGHWLMKCADGVPGRTRDGVR